jgi:hypothetical protein
MTSSAIAELETPSRVACSDLLARNEFFIIPPRFWPMDTCGCIAEQYEPTILD